MRLHGEILTFSVQFILILQSDLCATITHRTRKFNWERGLREATYQALTKERYYRVRDLRHLIYDAPIAGRHDDDEVTPFGDVTVLAKGQLFLVPHEERLYYRIDANDRRRYCCKNPPNGDRLLALWTIKRIRHRDSFGYKYVLEYKITPRNALMAWNEDYDGDEDYYGAPGHVFVMQTDSPLMANEQHARDGSKLIAGIDYGDDYGKRLDYDGAKGFVHGDTQKRGSNDDRYYVGVTYLPPATAASGYRVPKFLGKPAASNGNYYVTEDSLVTKYVPAILTPLPHHTYVTAGNRYDTGYDSFTRGTTPFGITTAGYLIPITMTPFKIPTFPTTSTPPIITKATTLPPSSQPPPTITKATTTTTTKATTTRTKTTTEKPETVPSTERPLTTGRMETQMKELTPLEELFGTTTTTTTTIATTKSTTNHPQIPSPTKPITTTEYLPVTTTTTTEAPTAYKTTTRRTTITGRTSTTSIPTTSPKMTSKIASSPRTTTATKSIPTMPISTSTARTISTTRRRTTARPILTSKYVIPSRTTSKATTTKETATPSSTTSRRTMSPTFETTITNTPTTFKEVPTTIPMSTMPIPKQTTYAVTEEQPTTVEDATTTKFTIVPTSDSVYLGTTNEEFTSIGSTTEKYEETDGTTKKLGTEMEILDVNLMQTTASIPTSYATSSETTSITLTPQITTIPTTTSKPTTVKSKPDPFGDIFGDVPAPKKSSVIRRKVRRRKSKRKPEMKAQEPKIIFSNFYEPGTLESDDDDDDKNSVTKKRELITNEDDVGGGTREPETSTSQSVFTSITFEVNKQQFNKAKFAMERPIRARVKEIEAKHSDKNTNMYVYEAEMPTDDKEELIAVDDASVDGKEDEIMQQLTLSVINHAKSIELLHKKSKEVRKRKMMGTKRAKKNDKM